MHNICTLIPYIYLVLLQFIINNKKSIFFVPYKIYSFFALMGNPVPLKIIQLFSENTIREIPESSKNTVPVPLKLSQDLSIKLIMEILKIFSSLIHIRFFDKAYKGFYYLYFFHNEIPFILFIG